MYYLSTLLATFLLLVGLASAQTPATVGYDTHYDDPTYSLDNVACSTGPNGLETKNYTTLGSLPTFPNVGAAYTVESWDSPNCGACYAITYGTTTINVLAIDKAGTGFTLSEEAMDTLTGGFAEQLGRVDVTFVQLNASECGLQNST